MNGRLPPLIGVLFCLFLFSPFYWGALHAEDQPAAGMPAAKGWAVFQEARYGATLYYPSNWFGGGESKEGGQLFPSLLTNGASLFLITELDPLRTGAAATIKKLKASPGGHRIETLESGADFYELRLSPSPGFQQVTRVVYTCKERIVSTVTLIYPQAESAAYEAMFLKLKRRFSVGVGMETPVRDCS